MLGAQHSAGLWKGLTECRLRASPSSPAESSARRLTSPCADLCSNSNNPYIFVKLERDDNVCKTL